MNNYIQNTIDSLMLLPGVGKSSATRYVNYLLQEGNDNIDSIIESLEELKKVRLCIVCGSFSISEQCDLCMSDLDKDILVVVANPSDVDFIENITPHYYHYHVIGGVINPLKGKTIDKLNLLTLFDRVNLFNEVLIVLPTTTEGEVTASYIIQKLDGLLPVSKIAQGIPIGGSIDQLDQLTLKSSIDSKLRIK